MAVSLPFFVVVVLLLLCLFQATQTLAGSLPPYPLAVALGTAEKNAFQAPKPTSTGVNAQAYLDTISGVVVHFMQFQNLTVGTPNYGKIIDPYAGMEIQYATPCFAFAGATLVKHGYFNSSFTAQLLSSVSLAVNASLTALVFGQPVGDQGCAQGHCNFYTMPLMFCLKTLEGIVDSSQMDAWRVLAEQIVPTRAYSYWPNQAGNWALVAATGEYVRYSLGLRPDIVDIVEQLANQFTDFYWTDNGEYQDHSGCNGACSPMPYDHFPRKYILVMLALGYNGPNASDYWALIERGAWTSLLLQSPWGELPTGARSSQHQWNEAVSTVTYEIFASIYASKGNNEAAGVFKRAASKSLLSLQRWLRPSGDWWIVKNRFDPSLRFGYEDYSFDSQYNLLPAAMLSTSLLFLNESIGEGASFGEMGGFSFFIDELDKVVGNAGGMYVEIELFPDAPSHDVLGLTRIHVNGTDPLVSITAGAPYSPVGGPSNPLTAGYGLIWDEAGVSTQSISGVPYTALPSVPLYTPILNSPNLVEFNISYNFSSNYTHVSSVVETYIITPTNVTVVVNVLKTVFGNVPNIGVRFPAFNFDGERNTTVSFSASTNSLMVELPGDATSKLGATCMVAQVLNGGAMKWTNASDIASRNGFMTVFDGFLASPSNTISYVLTPLPGPCSLAGMAEFSEL